MGYVEISKNKRTLREEPLVSIGSQGVLYLNKFVMHNYFDGINHVVFMYDNKKKRLAIKPIEGEKENSYRLVYTAKRKATGAVAARSVIKGLGIDYSQTKQYKAVWSKENKILEVQL